MILFIYFFLASFFVFAAPVNSSSPENKAAAVKQALPVIPRAGISVQTVYENFQSPLEYLEIPEGLSQSVTATKSVPLNDKLVQGKKLSLVDLKLENNQYVDVLYLVKNESASNRFFTISSELLSGGGKLFVECHCEGIYFSIPPNSAWTRVVRWTVLNANSDLLITLRNRVIGIDDIRMNSKLRNSIYKPK